MVRETFVAHSGMEHLHWRPEFGTRGYLTSPRAEKCFIEWGPKSQALLGHVIPRDGSRGKSALYLEVSNFVYMTQRHCAEVCPGEQGSSQADRKSMKRNQLGSSLTVVVVIKHGD
jgi:hypothetical protein